MAGRQSNAKGLGSIVEVERGRRYRLRVVVSPPGQPLKQRTETFHGTVTAARDRLAELNREAAVLRGMSPTAVVEAEASARRSVADLMVAWLKFSEQNGAAVRYVEENRRAAERRIIPAIGNVRLDQLTPKRLDDMMGAWADEGLSGASIRRYFAPLRKALDQAQRWGWVGQNVAKLATVPRGQASRPVITPTAAEVAALIESAREAEDSRDG